MIWVGKYYSWNLAFALVGVAMCISIVVLYFTQHTMGPIGLSPLHPSIPKNKRKLYEYLTYAASLAVIPFLYLLIQNMRNTDIFMLIAGPVTLLYVGYEMTRHTWEENKKLIAALIFILFSVLFWAFFEQSGGSLSLFALNNVKHDLVGVAIDPNIVNNSSNSL